MGNIVIKPTTNMHKRVGELLSKNKMTTRDLALILGFNPNQITAYDRLTGRRQFKENEIATICKKFNVSADWLLLGKE